MTMAAAPPARIAAIDWARTAALAAMVVFHFGRDLEVLGLVPPGSTFGGLWDVAALAIAGSFVALAGLSLWLAHGDGIRWRGFARRLGMLVAAAAAVSLATYLFMPGYWVRFGILHSIAASSVVALAGLRLPAWANVAAAAVLLAFGPGWVVPGLEGSAWLWTGLTATVPAMMDYEPLVPWLAPMLLGLAAGQLGTRAGLWARLSRVRGGRAGAWLAWPGRHSLSVYLIHQPVLVGGILGWAWLTG
jgi:uncharacterized membrane protein